MRKALPFPPAILLVILGVSLVSYAGEHKLGVIWSQGQSVSNQDAGVPFTIGGKDKMTWQCGGAATVCVDSLNCSRDGGPNDGVHLSADQLFATSNGLGGTGLISMIADTDAGCTVFKRDGTE